MTEIMLLMVVAYLAVRWVVCMTLLREELRQREAEKRHDRVLRDELRWHEAEKHHDRDGAA